MEELELLFQFVPPQQLRKRITEIWFHYLMHTETHALPADFSEMAEDLYFLISFLEKMKETKATETATALSFPSSE
jgi:hypothetical protein